MKTYVLQALLLFLLLPATAQTTVETVFADSTYQLTGVAVSKSNRIFTNYPRWSKTYRYALVEVGANNTVTPYPNAAWNTWDVEKGGDKMRHFLCVQAVVIDDENTMWVVDAGYEQNATGNDKGQKLVKIDLKHNTVARVYPLHTATSAKSYANDVRVDTKKNIAYLTNSNEGGLIIVDLVSGQVRQLLLATAVTTAADYNFTRQGKVLLRNGAPFRVHSDGIALSPDAEQLYFKALTDDRLFRIATKDLNDTTLSDEALLQKVTFLGNFTTTDGMLFDKKGNLYLGDLERRRLVRLTPALKMEEIIPSNEEFAWPDSYHISADGWLYISLSRIDEQAEFHNGQSQRKGAYNIVKVKV